MWFNARLLALGLTLVIVSASRAKTDELPPPTTAPSPVPHEPIPRDTLLAMEQTELGALYKPEDADRLYAAQQTLEDYFDASSARDRAAAVEGLERTGLDPNIIGRLARLRLHWPALDAGVYYINEKRGPYDVRYFLGVPKGYERAKPWPLVIKLPGANAFLTQPPPDGNRVAEIYTAWIRQELDRHGDALVLMPLLNLDEMYGPSYAGTNSVIQPMLHAADRVNIAPSAVYLIGHSEAAHAAWNLALHYPTYFSAFGALAGDARFDWQRVRLIGLRNVLPVVWHDDGDMVIKIDAARSLIRALRGLKLDVEFIQTHDLGHAPPDNIVEEVYAKMRARLRQTYPEETALQSTRPDPIFNRAEWMQLWQPIDPGQERRLYVRHGSGYLTVFANIMRGEARRYGNRIEVKSSNAASLSFYLNEQMVDFSKPLTIVVNNRTQFDGPVRPSIERMMNDQIFLGRGWRYFSAVVDVDLVPASTRPSTAPSTHKGTIHVGPSAE